MSKLTPTLQAGTIIPGPLRVNPLPANLVTLTLEQQELVNKAKKYAMEQSIKYVMFSKQPIVPIPQQPQLQPQLQHLQPQQQQQLQPQQQKSLHRHQALVLMCRVYVGSISFELKEETIKAAFNPFGAIKSINMSWDPVSLKHKGFAFVEYELPEAAQLALEHMNGMQLGGRQIKVGRPSNMPQAAPIIQQIQEECKEKNRIYVSNIHPDLFEPELANIFEPFGKVQTCKLAFTPNTEQPVHRGYGFIEFDSEAAATEALTMNNVDLGGQVLHVCHATTPAENVSNHGTLESETNQANTNLNSDEDIQLQLERTNKEQEKNADANEETHDQDVEQHNTRDTRNEKESIHTGHNNPKTTNDASLINGEAVTEKSVSNIIVLRNMVSADEDLDDGLQLDVYEECKKYGAVTQVVIYIDKKLPENKADNGEIDDTTHDNSESNDNNAPIDEVKIFVKYKDSVGSARARQVLNGRFFAGREVSAEHYDWDLFRLSDYSH